MFYCKIAGTAQKEQKESPSKVFIIYKKCTTKAMTSMKE